MPVPGEGLVTAAKVRPARGVAVRPRGSAGAGCDSQPARVRDASPCATASRGNPRRRISCSC